MVIYDLKSFLVKIYQKWTFMEEAKIILNAKRSITGSVATVDDGDLINHYGMILAHLATLFLKSWKKLYPSILDSKEIIQSILKKEISNVKIIIHFICAACRKPVITIWKTPRFFIQTLFFGWNDRWCERTFTTSCLWNLWNTRQRNEQVLEGCKQRW